MTPACDWSVASAEPAPRRATPGPRPASGRVLCFVDADTIVPENAVDRILELHEDEGRCLVLYRLASREPGIRAWLWWTFWGLARHLPLAKAKSMPAFMSCDRAHFETYGPFEESWAIAEEWPLTGAAYRHHRERFLYDRSLTARTSSRRMELQPFGYLRTFLKWVSVVLFLWARTSPTTAFDTRQAIDDPRAMRAVRDLAERAYFRPVPGSGAAASVREVLERSDRPPGRRASGAKAPLVLRASPGLDGWSAGQAPGYRRAGPAAAGLGGAGAPDLPEPSRYVDSDRCRRDAVLPCLAGETLATLLEDPALEESVRKRAIERAVVALAEFHRLGFTHGDAMAENVMVDVDAGVAHWFDFETIHESSRPMAWRRADDVRALLVTCLVRTVPEKRAETLQLILDVYADEEVTRILATSFTSVFRRPLTFHLAQAALSFQCFREIGRLLRERSAQS